MRHAQLSIKREPPLGRLFLSHIHTPLPALYPPRTTRRYDGYRLTYLGYDYLAIKTLVNRGSIAGVGRQVGAAGVRAAPGPCLRAWVKGLGKGLVNGQQGIHRRRGAPGGCCRQAWNASSLLSYHPTVLLCGCDTAGCEDCCGQAGRNAQAR